MNIRSLAFLVDGNSEIGLGHIYRCLSIAQEAHVNGIKASFILPSNDLLLKVVAEQGFPYKQLEITSYQTETIEESELILSIAEFDVILIDLLEESFARLKFLREKTDVFIVSLTSFYYEEAIRYEHVSFFPGMEVIEKKEIVNDTYKIRLFTGSKYFSFRDEFCETFERKPLNKNFPMLLITMGGADPCGFTLKVLDALEEIVIPVNAKIIIGEASPFFEQSKVKYQQLVREGVHQLILYQKVDGIAQLMAESDIAIINGGLTRYELAVVGTPFIAISIHELQYKITEQLTSKIGGINLGVGDLVTTQDIVEAIMNLLQDENKWLGISHKMQNLFDTNGRSRIIQQIDKAFNEKDDEFLAKIY